MEKLHIYFLLFIGSLMLLSCGATDSTTTYQISISASPGEGGTVSTSGGEYNEGETLEISATPKDGWRFDRWEGDYSGTSSMATITADSDKDIQAIFTKVDTGINGNYSDIITTNGVNSDFEITLQEDNGDVIGNGVISNPSLRVTLQINGVLNSPEIILTFSSSEFEDFDLYGEVSDNGNRITGTLFGSGLDGIGVRFIKRPY